MSANFVDFRTVKQNVSIEQVLEHYNIRLRRTNSNSLRGFCPLPTHTSERSRESFGVDVSKNIWACQSTSCAAARHGKKGGNILDLVATMESCSVREAAIKLNNWFLSLSVQKSEHSEIQKSETELVAERKDEVTIGNKPLSFALSGVDSAHQYLQSRGVSEATAKVFGVGFFPGRGSMSGRVVIPISNERGELVAYAGRAIDEVEPKYKFPSGFKKSEVLWNLNRISKPSESQNSIIVVERFFDAMKIHQAGFPHVVALMGSSMSEAQQKFLVEFSNVVLFLDGDAAGSQATADSANKLMFSVFVKCVRLAPGQQPDQLSSEDLQTILTKI